MTTRVLLVEDHTLVRMGIRALLGSAGKEVEVVGEAGNGRDAVELCRTLNPDLVLMDVAMPELNGIEAARQILGQQPEVRIIMLSMHATRQHIFESLKAGVRGYVLKDAAFADLLVAIRAVMAGRTHVSPQLSDVVMQDYIRRAKGTEPVDELEKLSGREREILQLIAEGKSSAEIADALHISVRTVDTHRHNLMEKLRIHSIAGLTRFAIRTGLCSLH
jgi:DNA-binding NarL/FixJ family response regulator